MLVNLYIFRWHGWGHARSQGISRQLSGTVTWIQSQVMSCGIWGGQSGTRAYFLLVLRFPLPILTQSTAPHSLIIYHWCCMVIMLTVLLNNQPTDQPVWMIVLKVKSRMAWGTRMPQESSGSIRRVKTPHSIMDVLSYIWDTYTDPHY
jgi:hypothetical protein